MKNLLRWKITYYICFGLMVFGIYLFIKHPEITMERKVAYALVFLIVESLVLRILKAKTFNSLKKWVVETKDWVDTGISAVIIAFFIMYFFLQAFKIPSGSMRTTLLEGDHLFVNKFIYGWHLPIINKRVLAFKKPQRGEIIIFRAPPVASDTPKDFIKRCIGIEGDTIEIRNEIVYLNGFPIPREYKSEYTKEEYGRIIKYKCYETMLGSKKWMIQYIEGVYEKDNFGPVKVPKNSYFVMGDNRDQSLDSRYWGILEDKYLRGKALLLYWPPKRIKIIR